MNIVKTLHEEFLSEAKKSPVLLADLANLEKYISESYSERSLIELIQNADDANSTKFYIELLSDSIILIANNGDYFTEEDVKALCRSGSSTKKRKSNTIGYRGIGFKSIVNYTNNVHLVSGDIKFSFSKELTKKELPMIDNVPLVRIPHEFNGQKYLDNINNILDKGYTTVFIFEIKSDALIDEINYFDESCLLFLRNIEFFISKTNQYKEIQSKRDKVDDTTEYISLINRNEHNKWLVLTNDKDNDMVNIAFLLNNQNIVQKSNKDNAVIHSFMPTKNKFIIPCKINGDFSTDPSRTKVVIDEESINTISLISKFFAEIIEKIVETREDKYNLIAIISSIYVDPISNFKSKNINDYFFNDLKIEVRKALNNEKFIIQPDWLSEESFLEIYGNSDNFLVSDSLNEKIRGLKDLLLILGFEEVKLENTLKKASKNKYSENTRVDLTAKIVEDTRFSLDDKLKNDINNAYLINSNDKTVKISDLKNKKISNNFVNKVEEKINEKNDFKWFSEKFNIDYEGKEKENLKNINDSLNKYKNGDIIHFKKKTNLTKWRSVELNVTELIKEFDDIKEAYDVSESNLGYDTKALDNNGNEVYYEIKSVNKLGDSIKITNNEYSQAHKYNNQYNLVIACQQSNYIEICIINNPIEKLNLTKRVVQWEWVCDEYEGEYSKTYFDD